MRLTGVLVLLVMMASSSAIAQTAQTSEAGQSPWKQYTIDELLNIDISAADRRPEAIRTTAGAVQVITRDELHRAGVRYLAEAFRLIDGLYVGRFDGRTWVVNARGLAINGANKMQVMIDGRTIYSPLFSGIFWDAQDLLVDDIDRIEVIRGPGASLWGANAVNGIINVVTLRAADTQGVLATVGGGNEERGLADVRYGGRTGKSAEYRVYAKYGYRDAQSLENGDSAKDPFRRGQVGGRWDWRRSDTQALTVQGDGYMGRLGLLNSPDTDISGGNVLARWRSGTNSSSWQIQSFYDRVARDVPAQFGERRNTFDVDAQQARTLGSHSLVWGGGYRASSDDTDRTDILFFDPKGQTTHLFNVFAQDEFAIGTRGVFATVGSKVEHNSYSGWELQPSGRIRWTRGRDTLWGAVSRAVRMPTRFDTDIRVTAGQPVVVLSGNPLFQPEALVAYEVGYRSQPVSQFSFDIATYVHDYGDLRSQDLTPAGLILLGNSVEGHITGVETGATWQLASHARVHGSYTWLHRSIAARSGSTDISGGEGNDAPHLATLQVFTDIRPDVRLNLVSRYVSALPRPHLPAYAEADVTLQWDVRPAIELALNGQNLLHGRHAEFTGGQPNLEYYDRSVFVTLTFRLQPVR